MAPLHLAILAACLQFGFVVVALFVTAAAVQRTRVVSHDLSVAGAIIIFAALGMAFFWISFLSPLIAVAVKSIFVLTVVLGVFWLANTWGPGDLALLQPMLVLSIGLFWLVALLVLHEPNSEVVSQYHYTTLAQHAWGGSLPGDNVIPFQFAEAIRDGRIPRPLHADWLSSDRPPLQTGMYLLVDILPGQPNLAYQSSATAFQALVLPAAWSLVRALGGSPRLALIAAALVGCSPFFIVNSVYVWPKFLAAALICCSTALYFRRAEQPRRKDASLLFGGAGVALSVLAHGATGFAVIGLGLAVLTMRRTGSWREIAQAAFAALLLYAPWVAYQNIVDPPGNRLAKWHLAGVVPIDARSTGAAIADSYKAISPAEWVEGRVRNLSRVVSLIPPPKRATDEAGIRDDLRVFAFFRFTGGLGALVVVVALLPILLMQSSVRPLVLTFLFERIAWISLMFEPGSTFPHQGSYLAWPLLGAIAVLSAERFGRPFLIAVGMLLALQICLGIYLYLA